MALFGRRDVDRANRQLSHAYRSRGHLEDISGFLCPDGIPGSFLLSGGADPEERYRPLRPVLETLVGRMPILILHSGRGPLRDMAVEAWQSYAPETPLWDIGGECREFEPFFGMEKTQAATALRQLALRLGYTPTPRFDRVARGHMDILARLQVPVSLTGFSYLCRFQDMGEFHDNILELSSDRAEGQRIWADLGVGEDGGGQFDLFRSVIRTLEEEAAQSGWDPENGVARQNCLQALRAADPASAPPLLLLRVNPLYAELLLTYLAEELRAGSGRGPFLLLLDGIPLRDLRFTEYLRTAGSGCCFGIVTENAADVADEAVFRSLCERMRCLVLFKHGTGASAAALAELFGKYDYTKVETSRGTSRGYFQFLPQNQHEDIRTATENRCRVMPEEITALSAGQAILLDTTTDQIIHFN